MSEANTSLASPVGSVAHSTASFAKLSSAQQSKAQSMLSFASKSGLGDDIDVFYGDNDVIMDCRDALAHLGARNMRQVHDLRLRSAYEHYGVAGEPPYTISHPSVLKGTSIPAVGPTSTASDNLVADSDEKARNNNADIDDGCCCHDYIFYSSGSLQMARVMAIPPLSLLRY